MILHTEVAFNKVKEDFNKLRYAFGILSRLLPVLFLIYALFAKTGILCINIALLFVSFADVLFHIIKNRPTNNEQKQLNKAYNKIFKYSKLFINGIKLGINVYLIYTTSTNFNLLSITLTSLSIISWIVQVLLEIIGAYILDKIDYLKEGIRADIDMIKSPAKKVGDFFKNITGKPVEEVPEPSKKRLFLQEKIEELKTERKEKKLAEKQAKKEAKAERKRTIRREIAISKDENGDSED